MRSYLALGVAALLGFEATARADEEKGKEAAGEAKEEAELRGEANLELVVGAGQVEALNPLLGSNLSGQIRYAKGLTDTTAAGLVLSGMYDVTPKLALGLRLPLAIAELRPQGDYTRTVVNTGNVELEAELKHEIVRPSETSSTEVELFAGGHLALPTSFGDELPSDATLAGSQAGIDPQAADKYAANHAVSSAYGDENTALWLAGYLGIVPVVGANLHFGRVRIEPYVKAECMFSVRDQAQERAIVEIVAGGRAAVMVTPWLDVGARAWGNFTVTDHEGDLNIGVVEPELRFGQRQWRVTLGLLIPFTGELADQGWISGRLSGTVMF